MPLATATATTICPQQTTLAPQRHRMQLLLLSNSTLPGEKYLGWPEEHLKQFLGVPKRIAFVPFAAVTMSLDDYANPTREVCVLVWFR